MRILVPQGSGQETDHMDISQGKNLGNLNPAVGWNPDLQGWVLSRGRWYLAGFHDYQDGKCHLPSYQSLHRSLFWRSGYQLFCQADCVMIYVVK